MITKTQAAPHESWPLRLKFALAVLVAAAATGVLMIAYVLFASDGTPSTSNGLTISSDDPLAVAEFDAGSTPLIGVDHWHASYAIYIGDDRQPNAPTWEGVGIHTHGDGIIHMHPFTPAEQGRGAALNKWFEYGGGELTETVMREPGFSATVHAGDAVPGDGRPGQIYIMVNGQRVPPEYIPHDGDQVLIYFASEAAMREKFPRRTPTPSGGGTATPPITGTAPSP
ncbi:MAG: hypothetical protein ABI559_03955 [Chloroflexota bacterium]